MTDRSSNLRTMDGNSSVVRTLVSRIARQRAGRPMDEAPARRPSRESVSERLRRYTDVSAATAPREAVPVRVARS